MRASTHRVPAMSEWRLAEVRQWLDACLDAGNALDDWLRRLSARRTHKVQCG
jgi:hypothetical protein